MFKGDMALGIAVGSDQENLVRLLVRAGDDLNARDAHGCRRASHHELVAVAISHELLDTSADAGLMTVA